MKAFGSCGWAATTSGVQRTTSAALQAASSATAALATSACTARRTARGARRRDRVLGVRVASRRARGRRASRVHQVGDDVPHRVRQRLRVPIGVEPAPPVGLRVGLRGEAGARAPVEGQVGGLEPVRSAAGGRPAPDRSPGRGRAGAPGRGGTPARRVRSRPAPTPGRARGRALGRRPTRRRSGRESTTRPAARAGAITSLTCCARPAAYRRNSASGSTRRSGSNRTSRTRSPIGVPPGSRVTSGSTPTPRSRSASLRDLRRLAGPFRPLEHDEAPAGARGRHAHSPVGSKTNSVARPKRSRSWAASRFTPTVSVM